jgi:gamma-glutamylcyclotransferase (GGCT)/AIG2-like uncharacterized protein YtfP
MDTEMSAGMRLATYGTLAPGRANHHQLADLKGRWLTGSVRGRLVDEGWGAAQGFPAIILDAKADLVAVHVFESADLPALSLRSFSITAQRSTR